MRVGSEIDIGQFILPAESDKSLLTYSALAVPSNGRFAIIHQTTSLLTSTSTFTNIVKKVGLTPSC